MSGSSQTLKFPCKQCGVILTCDATRAGQSVRCKACMAAQVVPHPPSGSRQPADDFDGYALRDEELPTRPTSTLPPWMLEDEPPAEPKRPQRPAGQRPPNAAAPARKPKTADHSARDDAAPTVDGWGDWGEPPLRGPRAGDRPRGSSLTAADEPPPEPPYGGEQLDLITGVWTMPWQGGEATLRWFLLSIGVSITYWLAALLLTLFADGGMFGALGGAFLTLVLVWIGLWTLSYGAACFLGILVDTANGARRVNTWPEGDWREWVFTMFQLAMPLAVSGAIGWGLGLAAETMGLSFSAVAGPVALLLFPVLLLSSVTEGSVLMPYSTPVWVSLVRMPLAWLLMYAAAALLVLPQLGLKATVLKLGAMPYLVLSGLWISAASFIFARLLGRLLCRIRFVLDLDDDDDEAVAEA